jgi:hypothetical protein
LHSHHQENRNETYRILSGSFAENPVAREYIACIPGRGTHKLDEHQAKVCSWCQVESRWMTSPVGSSNLNPTAHTRLGAELLCNQLREAGFASVMRLAAAEAGGGLLCLQFDDPDKFPTHPYALVLEGGDQTLQVTCTLKKLLTVKHCMPVETPNMYCKLLYAFHTLMSVTMQHGARRPSSRSHH